jgi:hypothetical protein
MPDVEPGPEPGVEFPEDPDTPLDLDEGPDNEEDDE